MIAPVVFADGRFCVSKFFLMISHRPDQIVIFAILSNFPTYVSANSTCF